MKSKTNTPWTWNVWKPHDLYGSQIAYMDLWIPNPQKKWPAQLQNRPSRRRWMCARRFTFRMRKQVSFETALGEPFLPVDRGGESFRDFMNNCLLPWKSLATIGKKKGWFNKFHHFLYSIEIYYHFCPNGSWLPGVTFSIARQLRSHSNLQLTEVPF